jgi:hypothetical protein
MSKTSFTLITLTVALLAVTPLRAGVKVTTSEPAVSPAEPATNATPPAVTSAEPMEKRVAFVTAEGKYLTASTGGLLDLTGAKIGSKQTFTIVDLNGGDLADGDSVKIRYTPNTGGVPDPSKASYWRESGGGVKRGKEAATFKLKKVEAKFSFQTAGGKFVTGNVTDGVLGLSDKQEAALLVEVVDVQASGKARKKTATE